MSVTSFAGALAAHSTPLLVAVTAIAGYLFGAVGQLGPAATTVGLNSFVAFIIFSSQPLGIAAAGQESALVFAGSVIQAALLMLAWPTARIAVERLTLADVYRNLATYAQQIAEGAAALPPITPFAVARQILTDPQPFASSADVARLNRLLEDSEIIRKRLGSFAGMVQTGSDREAVVSIARRAAQQSSAVADVLLGVQKGSTIIPVSPAGAVGLTGASDLLAHLRDATEAATLLAQGRIPEIQLLSKPKPGPYVRNRIDWLSRDCLRFALVLSIAMLVGRYFAADRGYWIPLTAALVLKPDFQTTFFRGFARIGGTLVGAVVATLVSAVARDSALLQVAAILIAAAAAYLTFNPNYAIFTVAITSFVVMVLRMRGLPGTTTIATRLLDTLAGGALAMIGYAAFPTWIHKRTRPLLADLIDAQRALATAILNAYASPSGDATKAIDAARTQAWQARTQVEASIDRSRQEPHRRHTIGPARALRILAATQRFGLANLALETALETEPALPMAELQSFAHALDDTMAELASALRASRRAHPDARLQRIVSSAELDPESAQDPRRRFVYERLRGYSEAASRIARLVG